MPFLDEKTGTHIPKYTTRDSLVGTPRFASLNGHNGDRLSHRDDIESAAYVLLYLAAGTLPWAECPGTSAKQLSALGRRKRRCSIALFCQDYGIPQGFSAAIEYARQLAYSETPNYQHLRDLYRRTMCVDSVGGGPKNLEGQVPESESPGVQSLVARRSPMGASASIDHGVFY